MPEPYSNDLRRNFFEAYDSGGVSLKELAKRFRVSESWAKKLSAWRSKTGQIEVRTWRHGPKGRVTAAIQEWMREQLRCQPDLTLQELQQRLAREHGLQLSVAWIWILLRRWGLRHKKNRSARKSKTPARTSGGGRRGGNK
jgi:transposase